MIPNQKDIENWLRRAERLVKAIPEGTEAHIGYGTITLYPAGKMQEHVDSPMGGWGVNDDSDLGTAIVDSAKFIPYSEGT